MSNMRTEWLLERKKGIGGSDAAKILGLSPWGTALDVWADKVGESAIQLADNHRPGVF